jgi:hypothetical protein
MDIGKTQKVIEIEPIEEPVSVPSEPAPDELPTPVP